MQISSGADNQGSGLSKIQECKTLLTAQYALSKPYQCTMKSNKLKNSFDMWLRKKRIKNQESLKSYSYGDNDVKKTSKNAPAENNKAFNDWLQNATQRLKQISHTTIKDLHRWKTRPLQDLIEVIAFFSTDNVYLL